MHRRVLVLWAAVLLVVSADRGNETCNCKDELAELWSQISAYSAQMGFLQKDNAVLATEMRELRLRLNKQDVRAVCSQPTLGLGKAACAITDNGGPWTVIQKRTEGDVLFSRNWEEYRNGFGDTDGDYWIGLKAIYEMCPKYRPCQVRFEFTFPGKPHSANVRQEASGRYAAQYGRFSIEGPDNKYRLAIGNYDSTASTAPDEMIGSYSLNGMAFTTKDADHDEYTYRGRNCASMYGGGGGWWYRSCHYANLNGALGARGYKGLHWRRVTGRHGSATSSRIMVRWLPRHGRPIGRTLPSVAGPSPGGRRGTAMLLGGWMAALTMES